MYIKKEEEKEETKQGPTGITNYYCSKEPKCGEMERYKIESKLKKHNQPVRHEIPQRFHRECGMGKDRRGEDGLNGPGKSMKMHVASDQDQTTNKSN